MQRAKQGIGWLAWGGWRMQTPDAWRPVKVEGDRKSGRILLATDKAMIAQIKWRQVPERDFDPRAWMKARLADDADNVAPPGRTPDCEGFGTSAWVPRAKASDGRDAALWYGHSARGRLVLELVLNTSDDRNVGPTLERVLLPSLAADGPDEQGAWSVFGASFRTPPGYALRGKHLYAGRISLEFKAGPRMLVLQQMYPAELSLGRRTVGRWFGYQPFARRRRRAGPAGGEEETFESFGRSLPGYIRYSFQQFGWPLQWVSRRCGVAAVAHDEELDRLLLAELDAPGRFEDEVVREVLGQMNWARLA